jgi:hypothetical protein
MPSEGLPRIEAIEPFGRFELRVYLFDSEPFAVDFSGTIDQGGVFSQLADMDIFRAVRIGWNNRIVEWPTPKDNEGNPIIEIDAESLRAMHEEQISSALRRPFGPIP